MYFHNYYLPCWGNEFENYAPSQSKPQIKKQEFSICLADDVNPSDRIHKGQYFVVPFTRMFHIGKIKL
jgi:hypothetical protein